MDTPTELEEHEIADGLERAHAAVGDAARRLMICHTPPYDTRLDRLVNGTPVGQPRRPPLHRDASAGRRRRRPHPRGPRHRHGRRDRRREPGRVSRRRLRRDRRRRARACRRRSAAGAISIGERSVIRAVTFDAAGTLIAPREPVGATYARIAGLHGIAADAATTDAAFRRAFASAPPMTFPEAAPSDIARHERGWWRAVVADTLGPAAAARPSFDACFDTLFSHYASATAWTLFADAPPALRALRDRGLRIGVVVELRRPAARHSRRARRRRDAVVWSTRAGAAKPAQRIFAAAASALGVPARRALSRRRRPRRRRTRRTRRGRTRDHVDRSGASAEGLTTLVACVDRSR
jgi:putative hydrolase of the HAD superfamily